MKRKDKVFVALSGGVDSSVAAALLKAAGFDVVAAHMVCWPGCEQGDGRRDALRVALRLNIPFLTFDFRAEYKSLIFDYMLREYALGRTPNPDVMCNREIKFGLFLNKAMDMGAHHIATGHYARLRSSDSSGELFEGVDKNKDQSYFLCGVSPCRLERCLFPLGSYIKAQVRETARDFRLPTVEKKDSQGLCFVGRINFGLFLRDHLPRREGAILTPEGTLVGKHDGVAFYTIGQRHGLGIGGGIPYYIAEKNAVKNILVVGRGPDDPILYKKEICVGELNWLSKFEEGPCEVRIRYRQPKFPALTRKEGDILRILFHTPQRGVAPGQFAAIYDGEQLLGGGVIL